MKAPPKASYVARVAKAYGPPSLRRRVSSLSSRAAAFAQSTTSGGAHLVELRHDRANVTEHLAELGRLSGRGWRRAASTSSGDTCVVNAVEQRPSRIRHGHGPDVDAFARGHVAVVDDHPPGYPETSLGPTRR